MCRRPSAGHNATVCHAIECVTSLDDQLMTTLPPSSRPALIHSSLSVAPSHGGVSRCVVGEHGQSSGVCSVCRSMGLQGGHVCTTGALQGLAHSFRGSSRPAASCVVVGFFILRSKSACGATESASAILMKRCQNSFSLCNRQLRHPVGASWRKSKPCSKNGEGQESNQSRWEELISFHLHSSSV